jgi:hypothetical protein
MKLAEELSSVRTMMSSVCTHTDIETTGLRSAANNMKRARGKDHRDWKVVTAITIEHMHSDSQFFASNPAMALPFFDAKGKGKLRSIRHDVCS